MENLKRVATNHSEQLIYDRFDGIFWDLRFSIHENIPCSG